MKKCILLLIILSKVVALLFLSCNKECDRPHLGLESEVLYFDEEGGELSVKITSNSHDWHVISNVDWLLCERNGLFMTVKALANKDATPRTSQIKVLAKGITRNIVVEQAPSPAILSPVISSATMPFLEGHSDFYIRTNIQDDSWKVDCDADWIKLSLDRYNNKVSFSVEKNSNREERKAVIRFYNGSNFLGDVFTVIQEGKPIFYLPYERWGVTSREVREFEEKRGNIVKRIPDGIVFKAWGFKTGSDQFDYIEYEFNGNRSFVSRLYPTSQYSTLAFNQVNMSALTDFFLNEGFVEEDPDYFVSEKKKMSATIVRNPSYGLPHIEYKIYAKQTEDYPTLPIEDFLGIFSEYQGNSFFTPLEYEYEKTQSGINDPNETSSSKTFFWASSPVLYRIYFLQKTGRILSTNMGFSNLNLVFYEDEGGNLFFTKEFLKLMNDAHFIHSYTNPYTGTHVFQNKERKLSFSVWYGSTKYTNGIKRVLTQVEAL